MKRPALGLAACVRKAQEIERLQPTEAPLLSLLGSTPPKHDQARLLGLQLQPELREPLA